MRQFYFVVQEYNFENMKSTHIASLLSLFLVLATFSCTVEKRVHLNGYHIEWNGHYKTRTKPVMVINEKQTQEVYTTQLSDSVGELIKSTIAAVSENNQDSVLEVIGKLMHSSNENNTLQANVNDEPKQLNLNSFSAALSRQFEVMRNATSTERDVLASDTTEKTPEYVESNSQMTYDYKGRGRGQRLGNWSLILVLSSLFIPYINFLAFLAIPFVAIPGIVQSNKELRAATGSDSVSQRNRESAKKGRRMSIAAICFWGFFVLLIATIVGYSINPY